MSIFKREWKEITDNIYRRRPGQVYIAYISIRIFLLMFLLFMLPGALIVAYGWLVCSKLYCAAVGHTEHNLQPQYCSVCENNIEHI